jgi:DNA-binding NtrC family response regulator
MAAILVVDDEPHIRLLLTSILRQQQHLVTEAQDGTEALHCLEHFSLFDLVITDVRMPKLDGVALLAILQRDYPTIPVIVMSAYRDRFTGALPRGVITQLQKPFSRQQFLEAVRRNLEGE